MSLSIDINLLLSFSPAQKLTPSEWNFPREIGHSGNNSPPNVFQLYTSKRTCLGLGLGLGLGGELFPECREIVEFCGLFLLRIIDIYQIHTVQIRGEIVCVIIVITWSQIGQNITIISPYLKIEDFPILVWRLRHATQTCSYLLSAVWLRPSLHVK